ncbi:unnamed protein product [Boreogadus saida]
MAKQAGDSLPPPLDTEPCTSAERCEQTTTDLTTTKPPPSAGPPCPPAEQNGGSPEAGMEDESQKPLL